MILFHQLSITSFLSPASPDELETTQLCSKTDNYIFTRCQLAIKSFLSTHALPIIPGLACCTPIPVLLSTPQPKSHLHDFHAFGGESFPNDIRTPPSRVCKPPPAHFSPLSTPCSIFDFLGKDAPGLWAIL